MRSSASSPPPSSSSSDEFYDSLDRILSRSRSCSSASTSDDDATDPLLRPPAFPPPAAFSYDVWISEPAPVAERRRRLLLHLGLSGDRTLSRTKSTRLPPVLDDPPTLPSPRSAVEVGRSVTPDALPLHPSPAVACSRSDGSVVPPTEDDDADNFLTIRNLDDGREFLVRGDTPLSEVSEVGTGRQLTMEEFELCVGHSPIVQELMRRQINSDAAGLGPAPKAGAGAAIAARWRKRRTRWMRSIKHMADTVVASGGHHWDKRSGEERDLSWEKGWRRSSSVADESLDRMQQQHTGPVRIGVRHCGKQYKELSSLFMTGEIRAHNGSIWCIKFNLNGQYLASAGEDHVIHVWEVTECESKGDLLLEGELRGVVSCHPFMALISNEAPESASTLSCLDMSYSERKRRARTLSSKRYTSLDHVMVPENIFALSEKPIRSFRGHADDILDLSWSKSQYLLSSSMDKTVKLWHMSSISCLKTFSHSDYVTCIQFNPVDDRYFISGSLDEKVRIWSIPDRKVVDWSDLHEMVTAVCYTPDGQSALVGSHKGSCHRYDTSDNKLHHKGKVDLRNKKKKSSSRKITGFQFAPGSSSEVLITSADSRIRVVNGFELVHKFKGFRNTSSQISASLSTNAKYVISASEDSHVYVWRHDADSWPSGSKGVVTASKSYEHFYCQDVTAAVPWPVTSLGGILRAHGDKHDEVDEVSRANLQVPTEIETHESSLALPASRCTTDKQGSNTITNSFGDILSATWPDHELFTRTNQSNPQDGNDSCSGEMQVQSKSAWRMVIVTAGRGGEIRIFQNFGFPVRI